MSSFIPRLNVLYYKHILDKSFRRFFDEYNDKFVKSDNVYVLSKQLVKSKIKKLFKGYIIEELKNHISEYSFSNPDYYIIIGSCLPKDNILLKYKQDNYIPEKIYKIMDREPLLRYYLKENDIHIDIMMFNEIFEELFVYFSNQNNIIKEFGKNVRNLFMIDNDRLDCKMMYETIRYIFGKVNVINLQKKGKITDFAINSLNEKIDQYVHGKHSLIESDMMIMDREEIKQNITNFMNFQHK